MAARKIKRRKNVPPIWSTSFAMSAIVTFGIGIAALYIILSDAYGQESLKWAYGAIGTLIGFWLRPPAPEVPRKE